jgi:hypothetical protein
MSFVLPWQNILSEIVVYFVEQWEFYELRQQRLFLPFVPGLSTDEDSIEIFRN